MGMEAFRYVWPSTGVLRARLLACFVLVMIERCINLAVPILFKNMVEALSAAGDVTSDTGGVAGWLAAVVARGGGGGGGNGTLVDASSSGTGSSGGGGGGDSSSSSSLEGLTLGAVVGVGVSFWGVFYPWAFYYLGTLFLRGGAGGEGLLADVRDILWIPITQVGCAVWGFGVYRGSAGFGCGLGVGQACTLRVCSVLECECSR